MVKINWKIVFFVFLTLLLVKLILEMSLAIISIRKMQMNATKIRLANEKLAQLNSKLTQKQYRVLLWTQWYQFKWLTVLDKHPNCPHTNCVFTDDRSDLSSFDAIVFHWYNTDPKDLPKKVYDQQKWVLYTTEGPHYTNRRLGNLGLKKIDWIMSYRTDSDVFVPYGSVVKCNPTKRQIINFTDKTKSVVWFVSNCKTPSNRETYAKKLQKYIDVDIYGACGPFKCKKYNYTCNQMIEKKYKFYLSFENSLCKDYVTEKTFINMRYNLIPVVLGGSNYSKFLPDNSYIDALNFSSPKLLAQYLKRVGSNQTLYNSYFEWKNNYCIQIINSNRNLCQLCERLNENKTIEKIPTLDERKNWWYQQSNCKKIQFFNETLKLVTSL